MSRCIIYDIGIQAMQEHIIRYKRYFVKSYSRIKTALNVNEMHSRRHKYWPFQFMAVEKNTERNNIKLKEDGSSKCQLYQCYVDLSELLFPGSERK